MNNPLVLWLGFCVVVWLAWRGAIRALYVGALLLLLAGCVHCERAGPVGPTICEM